MGTADKFDLYQMPDGSFLLAFSNSQDSVVGIDLLMILDSRGNVELARYDIRKWSLSDGLFGWDAVAQASLQICNPGSTEEPNAIVLRNVHNGFIHSATIFIRRFSWKVYAYSLGADP